MDAITGLSGAAPAYVFLMLEALTDGAVAAGLPREQALPLATQTMIGSARMVRPLGAAPALAPCARPGRLVTEQDLCLVCRWPWLPAGPAGRCACLGVLTCAALAGVRGCRRRHPDTSCHAQGPDHLPGGSHHGWPG